MECIQLGLMLPQLVSINMLTIMAYVISWTLHFCPEHVYVHVLGSQYHPALRTFCLGFKKILNHSFANLRQMESFANC